MEFCEETVELKLIKLVVLLEIDNSPLYLMFLRYAKFNGDKVVGLTSDLLVQESSMVNGLMHLRQFL